MTSPEPEERRKIGLEQQLQIRINLLTYMSQTLGLDSQEIFNVLQDTLCFLIMAGSDGSKEKIEEVSDKIFSDLKFNMIYHSNEERAQREEKEND